LQHLQQGQPIANEFVTGMFGNIIASWAGDKMTKVQIPDLALSHASAFFEDYLLILYASFSSASLQCHLWFFGWNWRSSDPSA
jgi:hypothetical protein